MKQLRNMWFLAMKDLKIFASDRAALFFSLLFPILFIVLFNFVMQDITGDDERLVINLATQEQAGGLSYQIIDEMLKQEEIQYVWLQDYDQAKQNVEDKNLDGFIAFPEDFTEAVMNGDRTDLEVVYNPTDTQSVAVLKGIAQSFASETGAHQVVINSAITLIAQQGMITPEVIETISQSIMENLSAQDDSLSSVSIVNYGIESYGEVQSENPANFVIPGYLVMFVFFTAAFAASQLVKERQNHTLERILTGSVTKTGILGGVYIGTVAKGIIQIAIFWIVGIFIFNIDLGIAPLAVVIISILMILMSSAFGVMLATFVKTEKSASSIGVLTSLILAPLGGCWWPLFITPEWMQFISKITPHAWATDAFNKLMVFGSDFNSVVTNMLVLVGFMVVFGIIAVLRFRTEAE